MPESVVAGLTGAGVALVFTVVVGWIVWRREARALDKAFSEIAGLS